MNVTKEVEQIKVTIVLDGPETSRLRITLGNLLTLGCGPDWNLIYDLKEALDRAVLGR